MSLDFANKLHLRLRPVGPGEYSHVFSANSSSMKVLGKVDASVNIDGLIVPYTFLVLEHLVHSVMFGIDILKFLQAKIDLHNNVITFADDLVCLPITKSSSNIVTATAVNTVVIPPCCEVVIPVRASKRIHGAPVMLEPVPELQRKNLLTARVTVNVHNNAMTVCRLLNPTSESQRVKKGEVVATLSTVDVLPQTDKCAYFPSTVNAVSPYVPFSHVEQELTNLGLEFDKSAMSEAEYRDLCNLLYTNKDIFATDITELPGTSTVKHHIDTGDAKPIRSRPYRHSPATKKEIARQIQEMAAKDLIRPSMSQWSSPVILVKKPHSTEMRFTIDYRKLNAVSKPMFFPLPTLDEIRDVLADKHPTVFTCCDLRSGFHQCLLTEESQDKAAFCTSECGNWAPKRMQFGLQGSPATFQLLMVKVLSGLNEFSLAYVDDICIFSRDWSSHLEHLQTVFDRLRQHSLRLHPKKCLFGLRQIRYLGHIISADGISPDDRKLQLIREYPVPKNQKQLRSAMGLFNYYRRFCAGYSKKSDCLRQLLKQDTRFVWTEECDRAFQSLKDCLCSAPVLAHADMSKQMILTCDGSTTGLGYVLSFKDDSGIERVVEFAGRGLRPNEQKFGISEIECLAVLSGIQYFCPFLANHKFLLKTDHSALQFLKSIKNPSGRLARWAIYLSQYTFDVQYTPGTKLGNADAISRIPYDVLNFKPPIPAEDVIEERVVAPVSHTVNAESQRQAVASDSQADEIEHCIIAFGNAKVNISADVNAITAFESSDNVSALQRDCPDLTDIIKYLENNDLPADDKLARKIVLQVDQFCIENGLLYHLSHPRQKRVKSLNSVVKQLCLPQTLREKFIRHYHDHLAHPGFQKLYETMREKFYWPLMYSTLQEYVATCAECQLTKRSVGLHPAPLQNLPVLNPGDMWITDVLGPFPPDSEDNRYALVCIDSCSMWPEILLLKTCDAQSTANALYSHIFCRYGIPMYLTSDRGTNYTSKLMDCLCKLCKIEQCFSTAYHHATAGRAEQFMSTILKTIRLYCKNDSDWSSYVDSVLLSYRALKTTSTHLSPYEVLFARQMRLPIDTTVIKDLDTSPDVDTYLQHILPKIELSRTIAKENHVLANEESKLYYDKNARYPTYSIGDRVLLQNDVLKPGVCRKLRKRYIGPFVVVRVCENYNFELQNCKSGKVQIVHANRLRPFRDDRSRLNKSIPVQERVNDTAVSVAPPNVVAPNDEWFAIDRLSQKRYIGGRPYYYVHWKDADQSKSWEPVENITPVAVTAFEELLRQRRLKKRQRKVN